MTTETHKHTPAALYPGFAAAKRLDPTLDLARWMEVVRLERQAIADKAAADIAERAAGRRDAMARAIGVIATHEPQVEELTEILDQARTWVRRLMPGNEADALLVTAIFEIEHEAEGAHAQARENER